MPAPDPASSARRPRRGPALLLPVLLATLALGACRSSGQAVTRTEPVKLKGVTARCTSIRGVALPEDPPVTLVFESKTRISGHGGLNAYAGHYERSEDPAISFSRIGSTRMAGPADLMRNESDFLAALSEVDAFALEGDDLRFSKGDEVLLTFVPLVEEGFSAAQKMRRLHGDDWPPATAPEAEWVKMNSGEWLKGKITSLTNGTLEFDSDELDELSLSYDDIAEIHTKRPFTVVFDDRSVSAFAEKPEAIGEIHLEGNTVFVKAEEDVKRFRREDLYLMVPGVPREANYWSADVLLGIALRSGNTSQTDVTFSASTKRRTANSRIEAKLDTVYGEQNDVEIANNQRLVGTYDLFLSRRFFVTPFGIELYQDRFQNIALRTSPYAGVGYTIFDRPKYEHDVTLAAGYRSTRYDSVEPGADESVGTATVNLGTTYSADLTPKIELEGSYSATMSVEDLEDTNQNAFLGLSFDFWKDFDLDVRFTWSRVGQPEAGEDGIQPKKDDLRIDIGLSWSM